MPRIDDLGLRADTAAGWAAAEVGGPATTAGENVWIDNDLVKCDGVTKVNDLPRAGSGTYVPKFSRRVWSIGDSLTAGNSSVDAIYTAGIGQGGIRYGQASWQAHAILASQGRWTHAGQFATPSWTASQILGTHVPAVLAASSPGDVVVVLAGTNGNNLADTKAIHDALRSAGRFTVACTIPPSIAAGVSIVPAFNAGLAAYAAARQIPLADIHSAVVDPATGAYSSSLNGDGVHPNAAGYAVFGQTIAATLATMFPAAAGALVGHNATISGSLQPNPLAQSALTNNTDYALMSGMGTSTIAKAANASFFGGQAYRFTRGDTDINARLATWTLVAGHRYRIGMALQATIANSGMIGISLESATTGQKTLWAWCSPQALTASVAAGKLYSEFVCPTLPDYVYRLKIGVWTGSGTVLDLGEITMFDLTAMGVA